MQIIEEYLKNSQAVGASVCFIDQGISHFFSYGKKAIDQEDPITEETLYEIGSITKIFTALALMESVQQGQLNLDDPVEKFLPKVKVPQHDGIKMTLRHLATHTSGLPWLPDNFSPQNPNDPYADYSVERLYAFQICLSSIFLEILY